MTEASLLQRVRELEAQNQKLQKINRALIERVESGVSHSTNPYAAFEHSVVLAEQVRDRTEELNNALSELKLSHQELGVANREARLAHQRLKEGIESIDDAFVLFDSERRIVLYNSRFAHIWIAAGLRIETGLTIQDLSRLAHQSGLVAEEYPPESGGNRVYRLNDGRWMQMTEKPTQDGGLVVLYIDITALREREIADRERALAQKSRLLQNTVDNLSQGVVLVTPEGRVELWNDRFLELTGVGRAQVETLPPFAALMLDNPTILQHAMTAAQQGEVLASEQRDASGRVVEVRTHPMPHGGFVNTYTDITERHQYAESLRQQEQWLRLITDNVPAQIAYLDRDLCYGFTNRVYEQWFGATPGSLIGASIHQLYPSDQFDDIRYFINRALEGESVTFECWQTNANGERRFLLKSYVANFNQENQPDGFFVMIRDITERRQSAEALQQSYQLLEQRVEERTSELTGLNQQLRQEIQERKVAEAGLLEAKQEAEAANMSKTKFLAAVSHDLLQPLNAARLFSASLDEQLQEPAHQALAASVSGSLDDVESLLRTLVDISKLDAGVVQADIMPFKIQDLLGTLSAEYSQLAAREGLDFSAVRCAAVVRTDSQLLARILRNFLSNAIRYTAAGKVLLGCRYRGHSLVIEVWDTGCGIPQSQQQRIFDEFQRLQGERPGQERGLGLGLAIVDKISSVLGHKISVRSEPGKGSVFSVEVPLERHDRVADSLPVQVAIPSDNLQQRTVWLIDNDPAICEAMTSLLQGWGCRVCTGLSLDELLLRADSVIQRPDLLIVDYHLEEGITGLTEADRLQQHFDAVMPVLMITANYSNDLNQSVRDLGYMLLHKPVKPLKLKTAMIHLLSSTS